MISTRPFGSPSTVSQVNDERKRAMGRKVIKAGGGSIKNRTIAILGLAFKPNTDGIRNSPPIAIIQVLQDAGARMRAYDPEAMDNARAVTEYALSAYGCLVYQPEDMLQAEIAYVSVGRGKFKLRVGIDGRV
jgi:UDPglucose 6-dehydrogenase